MPTVPNTNKWKNAQSSYVIMKGVFDMKRCLLSVALLVSLAFLIAGCMNAPGMGQASVAQDDSTTYFIDYSLRYNSYEELAQAKAKAAENGYKDDVNDLEGLDFYYVPVYAEKNWEFTSGRLFEIRCSVDYNRTKTEKTNGRNEFMISVTREGYGDSSLAHRTNPASYSNGVAPTLLEGAEGIYYEDLYGEMNAAYPVTQFHWEYDGYYCFMVISKVLMDEIKKNDPEALKGPLFELQKVELK